ncbi:hypothetical protein EVAR_30082_1 [Eumeta japonica]|uniref:Uncharacterized protein n=1 Tax=Eumeta variegata TaxID=151549 RepID=A0A4C1X9I0_EUMVA|nr:hypothetical protein EVAR_30082_1 [Eumeta japonica]
MIRAVVDRQLRTLPLNQMVLHPGNEQINLKVTKLDHHRGPVTGVKVIQDGEILVTCSQDGTVCTWNVTNFTLLSTVTAGAPIHAMDVTDDNVFLITLQGDNELHLRTFITGTHLHLLKRHKAKNRVQCNRTLRPRRAPAPRAGLVGVVNVDLHAVTISEASEPETETVGGAGAGARRRHDCYLYFYLSNRTVEILFF